MLPLLLNALLATAPAAPEPFACPAQSLEVMVFNIEYGGDLIDFRKVLEAIRAGGAPVVAIEEAWAQMPKLANALAWPYYDSRTQIVSRLPLVERRGENSAYTLVEVSPGCAVALVNVHLPSDPYGPDLIRSGAAWPEVEALERKTRLPAIAGPLAEVRAQAATGMPVFLSGDFNAPSFRDDGQPWPVSKAVEAAGLRDSYREVHPDAKALPGFTWWAARPQVKGWNPDPKDAQVRIDFIYSTANARATSSRIIGERDSPGVAVGIEPWPSDHRAVVSKFDVTGAPLPAFISVPHEGVSAGDELVVQFHTPADGSVVLLPVAGAAKSSRLGSRAAFAKPGVGMLRFPTEGVAPGAYEAQLLDSSRGVVSRAPFWVEPRDARPQVGTDRDSYKAGEAITVAWRHAPGNRWDWVGVYPAGADPRNGDPGLWRHTKATIAGTAVLDANAEGGGWPLTPGKYDVHLLLDDSYESLAEASFEVLP